MLLDDEYVQRGAELIKLLPREQQAENELEMMTAQAAMFLS